MERSHVTCLLLNCGFRNFDFGVTYFLSLWFSGTLILELRIFCFVVSGILFVDFRSCCLPSVCFSPISEVDHIRL